MQNFMVQNNLAGEQQSHWDKTNKGNCHLKLFMSFVLSCPSAIFALRHGGFVPREWLAAKKRLSCLKLQSNLYTPVTLENEPTDCLIEVDRLIEVSQNVV